MMRRLIAAALLAAFVAPATAATWTVDPARSTITFKGSQTGEAFSGRFKSFAAQIDFDPASPGSGHAVVAVDTGSAVTGDPQKDEALPGADWFDTSGFPKATFEATSFKALGGDRFEADGTLSIRDVKKPLALPFTLTTSGDTAHAVGEVQLSRNDFGVGRDAWASDQYVGFAVAVGIDLTATRAK